MLPCNDYMLPVFGHKAVLHQGGILWAVTVSFGFFLVFAESDKIK